MISFGKARQRATVILVASVVTLGTGFGVTAPAGDDGTAEGSAFGVSAEGLVDVDPTPLAEFPPGEDETAVEVDLGSVLLACGLTATSQGFDDDGDEVANEPDASEVRSDASVADVTLLGDAGDDCTDAGTEDTGASASDLGDLLDDLIGLGDGDDPLLDLVGGDGIQLSAISSSCVANEDGASGASSVVGLGDDDGDDIIDGLLDLDGLAVDLGIVEVVADEQITTDDGIIVRALRLTVGSSDNPALEVILAESRCEFAAGDTDPDPDPDPDNDKDQPDNDKDQADNDKDQADNDKDQADNDKDQADNDKDQADNDKDQADNDKDDNDKDQADNDKDQADNDKSPAPALP